MNFTNRYVCKSREREGPFVEMIKRMLIGGAILVALIAALNSVRGYAAPSSLDKKSADQIWQNTQTKP